MIIMITMIINNYNNFYNNNINTTTTTTTTTNNNNNNNNKLPPLKGGHIPQVLVRDSLFFIQTSQGSHLICFISPYIHITIISCESCLGLTLSPLN